MKVKTILLVAAAILLCRTAAFAADCPKISAECAVLYDAETRQVLYGKNEDLCRGMASTTKIMTALVALEQYDLQQNVTIRPEWTGIEGSSMYLKPGEKVTVEDLLYGLLLASGNDAATALAGLHPRSIEGFVSDMNKTAEKLELIHTRFENPSGLDGNDHYSTALDLAVLASEAMKDPVFAEIVGTEHCSRGGRWLKNHNRLLGAAGVCGVKTGYTKACGRCLVSAKKQNGKMLICVTLNAPNDWQDHKALYQYGFEQYREITLVGAGNCGSVPLIGSEKKASQLYINDSYSGWFRESEIKQINIRLCGPRFWYGETTAGTQYGTLQVLRGNKVLFETKVFFADSSSEVFLPETWAGRLYHYFFG